MRRLNEEVNFTKLTARSEELAYLAKLSAIVSTLSEYIVSTYLSSMKISSWRLSEDRLNGRILKRLHHVFLGNDPVLPIGLFLLIATPLFVWLEPLCPMLIALLGIVVKAILEWEIIWTHTSAIAVLASFAFIALFFIVLLFSAVGMYWVLFELAINDRLFMRVRILVLSTVLAFLLIWLFTGSFRVSNVMLYRDSSLEEYAKIIQQTPGYAIASAVFIYIPALIFAALLLVRGATLAVVLGSAIIRWSFRYHTLYSIDVIVKFLSTPLLKRGTDEIQTLLDLDVADFGTLRDWAICRRQIVQNRLVPVTMLLASLSLLANTYLGKQAVTFLGSIVIDFFQPPSGIEYFVAYFKMMILLAGIIMPLILVGSLLTEAFVMDNIVQACVLAEHARRSQQTHSEVKHQAKELPLLFGWIRKIL